MRLKNVEIERFKRLKHVNFDVGNVNILVGGNNSGKSTIIQAIHFAFTLLQSLNISNKWPATGKYSSTISPSELIYIPSEDPYSLGYGGQLLEDKQRSIVVLFRFEDGRSLKLEIRKGRITNLIVEPDDVEFGRTLSSLEAPYSVYSPGLAGVSRTEIYVSDGVLLRALARGDANIVLRNILYRLNQKVEWSSFKSDLSLVFPNVDLVVKYDPKIDQYIDVRVRAGNQTVPLDLSGTGLLQTVQILAYLHLFTPKLIVLDEPDSHLHPNNQRLLCSLLSTIALERNVQIIMTTHSRHVLDSMYSDAVIQWVQNGMATKASADDQVDILLELGALDIKEKLQAGKYKVVVLTEDNDTQYLKILLKNSGFALSDTAVLSYRGVTTLNLLQPLVAHVKANSSAAVVVHRDRDFLEATEADAWKKDIHAMGAEPFVTMERDIEGYFCNDDYLQKSTQSKALNVPHFKALVTQNQVSSIIENYVNGRLDIARKNGTIGKVNIGQLSASASQLISTDPWSFMKGKTRLKRVRAVCTDDLKFTYKIDQNFTLPTDAELTKFASKHFKKPIPGNGTS